MIQNSGSSLSTYLTGLLSAGRVIFSDREASQALGISRGAFLDAAERLQRRSHLLRLRRGFYVVVPPQYLSWGAPPPSWYIDDLMRHEGRPYYVGLLKAAELHGATHQAVMQFQVVTDKRLPEIRAGRSLISFHFRKDMVAIESGVEERKTDTGHMKISSVELTVLDLLRYPRASAGLDNVVTVLSDLGIKLDSQKLATLSASFERSVVQRLGYLLDRLGHADRTAPMLQRLSAHAAALPWIELDPAEQSEPGIASDRKERDDRWHVIVRRVPVVDE